MKGGTREQRLVPGAPPFWTDERVKALTKSVADGMSYGQIAKLIGGGCTKNAALGKAMRLGIGDRPAAARPGGVHGSTTTRKTGKPRSLVGLKLGGNSMVFAEPTIQHPPRFTASVAAFEPLPGSTPRVWTERLPGMCCWPVGDEGQGERSCCLKVAARGWCSAHLQRGLAPAGITHRENVRVGIVPMRRAARG